MKTRIVLDIPAEWMPRLEELCKKKDWTKPHFVRVCIAAALKVEPPELSRPGRKPYKVK